MPCLSPARKQIARSRSPRRVGGSKPRRGLKPLPVSPVLHNTSDGSSPETSVNGGLGHALPFTGTKANSKVALTNLLMKGGVPRLHRLEIRQAEDRSKTEAARAASYPCRPQSSVSHVSHAISCTSRFAAFFRLHRAPHATREVFSKPEAWEIFTCRPSSDKKWHVSIRNDRRTL